VMVGDVEKGFDSVVCFDCEFHNEHSFVK
jgi:hypothetical protein